MASVILGNDVTVPRGRPFDLPLPIDVSHPGGGNIREVLPLNGDKHNFRGKYTYSDVLLMNDIEFLASSFNISNMTVADSQKGLEVGGNVVIGNHCSRFHAKLWNTI